MRCAQAASHTHEEARSKSANIAPLPWQENLQHNYLSLRLPAPEVALLEVVLVGWVHSPEVTFSVGTPARLQDNKDASVKDALDQLFFFCQSY